MSNDGEVIWGEAIDLATKNKIPGLIEEAKSLRYIHPYLLGIGDDSAKGGLINTSHGLMLTAVAPITKGDRQGPPAGMILMASFLNEEAISELTSVTFHLADASSRDAGSDGDITSVTNDEAVETSSLLKDLSGRPLRTLHVITPRDEIGRAHV